MTNPYNVDTDKVRITYSGYNSDFYCFRIHTSEFLNMTGHIKQTEISQWLLDNATMGEWFMGNGFPYSDHPHIFFENSQKHDIFVILKNFSDVIMFEKKFKVTGITPSMLNP